MTIEAIQLEPQEVHLSVKERARMKVESTTDYDIILQDIRTLDHVIRRPIMNKNLKSSRVFWMPRRSKTFLTMIVESKSLQEFVEITPSKSCLLEISRYRSPQT